LIDGILSVIDMEKRDHHRILVCLFEFLRFSEILKLGRVNRKLYIVSGDTKMLRNNFMRGAAISKEPQILVEHNHNSDH
jgi:hypothetical protein